MFKKFKKIGASIQDASKAVGKGIQHSAAKTGAALKKGTSSKKSKSDAKSRAEAKSKASELSSRQDESEVMSTTEAPPQTGVTSNSANASVLVSRAPTPVVEEPPAPAAEEVLNLSLSDTDVPAPPVEDVKVDDDIVFEVSSNTSSIKFGVDSPAPPTAEDKPAEGKTVTYADQKKDEKEKKKKESSKGSKEEERKKEKRSEKVSSAKSSPALKELPSKSKKSSNRSTPQERPLSRSSVRSGGVESERASSHRRAPSSNGSVRRNSHRSSSRDSRASMRSESSKESLVSVHVKAEKDRKKSKSRHGQRIPGAGDDPTSFDLYAKRKSAKSRTSPTRRRKQSPLVAEYLDLLKQCREDANYLYTKRSRRRSPSYERRETQRYPEDLYDAPPYERVSRRGSRTATPTRGFREPPRRERRMVSPYRQGNYNWRERDIYMPLESEEEEYVERYAPGEREYYRGARREYDGYPEDVYDGTLHASRLSPLRRSGRVSPVRRSRASTPLQSHHSSRVASPRDELYSLPIESRFRSPHRTHSVPASEPSVISERELLEEVEWKLDALAQEIVIEDAVLEEKMRSNTFDRLYHMNNRRDRDERRKKLVQYTSLEKIRQKLLDGSVDREIEERERKRRQQEALLQDPSGVYLRLYNNSYAAARGASPSGEHTPRRPSKRNSALSNGSTSRRPTPKRSSSYIKEMSSRLYNAGAAMQSKRKEVEEITHTQQEEQELEDFLVARLMARIERDRMVKGRILSYPELEDIARQQVRQQLAKDKKATEEELLRGRRLTLEDQERMAKRLAAHGYVNEKVLKERRDAEELKECTFTPQINPRSAQLANNGLERYIEKTILPDGTPGDREDGIHESGLAEVEGDRCQMLYEKAGQREEQAALLAAQREEELKRQILQSKLENDHHFRKRVELDPLLAERFMRSLVV